MPPHAPDNKIYFIDNASTLSVFQTMDMHKNVQSTKMCMQKTEVLQHKTHRVFVYCYNFVNLRYVMGIILARTFKEK